MDNEWPGMFRIPGHCLILNRELALYHVSFAFRLNAVDRISFPIRQILFEVARSIYWSVESTLVFVPFFSCWQVTSLEQDSSAQAYSSHSQSIVMMTGRMG